MKKYKSIVYYDKDGEMHRSRGKGPAYQGPFGSLSWFYQGMAHRIDGPAFISSWGGKEWWLSHNLYGKGDEPPEDYLKELEILGIKFIRGSDVSEDYPE